MGLFDRWFSGGGAPKDTATPLPANAVMFANDVVLSALIGPPGAPVEEFLARAARGEVTPVVIDASLYWTWCAVQPDDRIDLARFAELLRYARIVPLHNGGEARTGHGWNPPTEDEKSHWRNVVFGRQDDDGAEDPPAPASPDEFLCSACYSTHPIAKLRVIPWWNADARDVFTTYRCESCWLGSLDETRVFVESAAFDAEARAKFVAFLERHKQNSVAARVRASGAAPLLAFLRAVRTSAVVLTP